jgi:hypothetical protein
MDKNIIKQHLTQRFVSEAKIETGTPGITVTNAANKKSGEINKAGVKAVEKDVKAYDKELKSDASKMAQNKFNYEDDSEKEYHDQMEIMNGQEMLEYDRVPNKTFSDKAKEGLEGSSRMGNKGGKEMGNAEAIEGVSSDEFGKERLKNAEASAKKRKEETDQILSFGDVIIPLPKGSKPAKVHSAYQTNETENKDNNKPQIKESMKRLKFKKEFNGVGNALQMIPESYRVDNKVFEMTDGNETYKIRWEGNLNEGKAVVLLASDKTMVNEDMQKMKHLMGYKSQETLGLVKGNARINENAEFTNVWAKTKTLLEGEDIEDETAAEGDLNKVVKHAPEAKKHVEGSVSTEKGTKAPAAKTGNLEDIKKSAPEATKHVEGSVSTEKGTKAPAAKTGAWDDVTKKAPEATKHVTMKESMYEGAEDTDETEEVTTEKSVSTKNGHWEDINMPHAAEAKKHVHMSEGIELGGTYFAPINEEEEDEEVVDYTMGSKDKNQLPNPPKTLNLDVNEGEEDEEDDSDDWNKGDDEEDATDVEPTDTDIASNLPDVDDEDEDDVVIPPAPSAAKSGPRLMVSQSTGAYYIVGAGPTPISVPLADKERAKMNPAKYAEEMLANMDDDGQLDEYGDEHEMPTSSAVKAMDVKKKANEDVNEGLGDFFRGGSKEEIAQKQNELEARFNELEAEYGIENLMFADYGDKPQPYTHELAMSVARKNNFLGQLRLIPREEKLFIVYKPGAKGMNKLGSVAAGSMK